MEKTDPPPSDRQRHATARQQNGPSDRAEVAMPEKLVSTLVRNAQALDAGRQQWEYRDHDRINPEGLSDETLLRQLRTLEKDFNASRRAALKDPAARQMLRGARDVSGLANVPDPFGGFLPEELPAGAAAGTRQAAASPVASKDTTPNSENHRPDDKGQTNAIRDLLAQIKQTHAQAFPGPTPLGRAIDQLIERSSAPGQAEKTDFRRQIAYALEDVERLSGPVATSPALRQELKQLAGSLPGLTNERMADMLRSTAAFADQKPVAEIRQRAKALSKLDDQESPEARSAVEATENLFRLAAKVVAERAVPVGRAVDPSAVPQGATRLDPVDGAPQPAHRPDRGASFLSRDDVRASIVRPEDVPRPAYVRGPGALATILRAVRDEPRTLPPWERPHDSLERRHARFEETMGGRRDDQALSSAERSGRAALDALQGFSAGPGASMLAKIHDAAKADPRGMQGVLSEMRDGGRYADLRKEFNTALVAEKGFAAAYDRAATALGQYGDNRIAADQILTRRPDAAAIAGKFEKFDAEIGRAAAALPGRADGKSALDELAEKAREVISKAVETVRAAFGRGLDAASRPAPAPSFGP